MIIQGFTSTSPGALEGGVPHFTADTQPGELAPDHSRMVFPDGRCRVVPIKAPALHVTLGERSARTPLWSEPDRRADPAAEMWHAPHRSETTMPRQWKNRTPGEQREAARQAPAKQKPPTTTWADRALWLALAVCIAALASLPLMG
jgi:hypothetical protein